MTTLNVSNSKTSEVENARAVEQMGEHFTGTLEGLNAAPSRSEPAEPEIDQAKEDLKYQREQEYYNNPELQGQFEGEGDLQLWLNGGGGEINVPN